MALDDTGLSVWSAWQEWQRPRHRQCRDSVTWHHAEDATDLRRQIFGVDDSLSFPAEMRHCQSPVCSGGFRRGRAGSAPSLFWATD